MKPRTAHEKALSLDRWHTKLAEAEAKIPTSSDDPVSVETLAELRSIRDRLRSIRHSMDAAALRAMAEDVRHPRHEWAKGALASAPVCP